MATRRTLLKQSAALGIAGVLPVSTGQAAPSRTSVPPASARRGHRLAAQLAGTMDVTWLNRTYPREEYIRDGEWEELAGDLFDCVVVHSDDDRPETVTVDGRTWTADITCGEDRLILDVTGKMTSAAGIIMGTVLCETAALGDIKADQVEAHRKRQRERAIRYMPA